MGLQPAKSLKVVIFGINFPKKGIPLKRFLQNLAWGGCPRFAPSCQIVSLSVKKCGSTAPKIAKIGIFLYKFARKEYTPLSHFYNILPGERALGLHPHPKFHRYSFKNVRSRVMYMTCKEQFRLTGAPSYGCVLVISNTVRHNYKLNHTKLIDILSV